jgi:hypothetical protein
LLKSRRKLLAVLELEQAKVVTREIETVGAGFVGSITWRDAMSVLKSPSGRPVFPREVLILHQRSAAPGLPLAKLRDTLGHRRSASLIVIEGTNVWRSS